MEYGAAPLRTSLWHSFFEVKGVIYSCTEQYMMAEKARLFGDEEMLAAIMLAKHPKEMKAFGRAVRSFDQAVWQAKCYDIVKAGNLAKFSQNEPLWDYMKTTKNRILVEASPRDRIWGIGMGKSNPDVENPMKWRGKTCSDLPCPRYAIACLNDKERFNVNRKENLDRDVTMRCLPARRPCYDLFWNRMEQA